MKIAQVAPVWERVPPRKYGGIELVVSLLTEELVRQGHEVTLFATGDAKTKAKLSYVFHTAAPRQYLGNPVPDLMHVGAAFHRADEFDIIQNHAGYSGVTLANFVKTPVLTTLHGIFTDINTPFFKRNKNACFYNSISDEQRKPAPELNYISTIYNAIDTDSYPFEANKKDYFVYISRINKDKGSDVVIDIAKKAGVKLIMAGKIDPGRDTEFFEAHVHPKIDDKQIIYKGEISEKEKRKLFAEAKGFIFPLQWPEPFGLVIPEAMACGTPVISFPYGSLPELVEDGKTGFIVKTNDEMVEAVKKIDQINPQDCRDHTVARFGIARMTGDYLKAYEAIIKKVGKK
ncbi:MAG: glycosyltransferase family 4 protein [Actinobacteria bacterium]|nr:MAG: glycosyltransferase family 4 protein [Actinomycetota bacterium]